MLVKTEGIVLRNIKYADKKIISKIFTRDFGLVSTNAITGNSPSSKIKSSSILPLHQLEIAFTNRQNKEVQQLTEARCTYIYTDLLQDYNKLAIAQFLNEVLSKCIKEHIPNEAMFDFIIGAYRWLNEEKENTNDFHIYFLFELSRFLGFEPHNTHSEHCPYFDTREGKFSEHSMSFPMGLDKQQSITFLKLFDEDLIHKKFSRAERAELLECLIAYYKMQVANFGELKSLNVLKELFV
jgi:DNA repair protein RecO (recombination protein O)